MLISLQIKPLFNVHVAFSVSERCNGQRLISVLNSRFEGLGSARPPSYSIQLVGLSCEIMRTL